MERHGHDRRGVDLVTEASAPGTESGDSGNLELTLEELARLTDEPVERLRHWQALGLLPPGEEPLPAKTAERVRLVQHAVRRGVDAEEIARICAAQGDLIADFVEQLRTTGRGQAFSRSETAALAGVPPELLERVWLAAGLREQPRAYQQDVEALRTVAAALRLGLPEEVLLQLVRVFATSQAKVAEATSRLFHFYVHERLRAEGLRGADLMAATRAVADPLSGLIEPTVIYFHRKAWERAIMDDMVVHLREEANPPASVPGEVIRTVLFVDLSAFTPLTEAMGDGVAAEVLARFSEVVREVAASCDGEIVKQIGDAFMLVFPDAASALTGGLEIERHVTAEPKFPAVRIGAHAGSVLYREGDYVGVNVNIAARVAATAERHQFVVTDLVRVQAQRADVEFEPLGAHKLKGLRDEIELFHAYRSGERPLRAIDPVCGMELDAEGGEARLNWRGEELFFCSPGCVRRFLDDPDSYVEARS